MNRQYENNQLQITNLQEKFAAFNGENEVNRKRCEREHEAIASHNRHVENCRSNVSPKMILSMEI